MTGARSSSSDDMRAERKPSNAEGSLSTALQQPGTGAGEALSMPQPNDVHLSTTPRTHRFVAYSLQLGT